MKQATLTSSAQPAPVEMWPIDTGRHRDLIDPETSDMIASGQSKEASTLSLWAFATTVGVIAFAIAYRLFETKTLPCYEHAGEHGCCNRHLEHRPDQYRPSRHFRQRS